LVSGWFGQGIELARLEYPGILPRKLGAPKYRTREIKVRNTKKWEWHQYFYCPKEGSLGL
jgi:hypothetical protein